MEIQEINRRNSHWILGMKILVGMGAAIRKLEWDGGRKDGLDVKGKLSYL